MTPDVTIAVIRFSMHIVDLLHPSHTLSKSQYYLCCYRVFNTDSIIHRAKQQKIISIGGINGGFVSFVYEFQLFVS